VESIERASKTDEIMACQSPQPLIPQVRWKISVLGHWYYPVHWHWTSIETFISQPFGIGMQYSCGDVYYGRFGSPELELRNRDVCRDVESPSHFSV
jgi:hypothetical protein